MGEFRLTNNAEADLDEIWEYIAQDSPLDATRFVDHIVSRFPLLADNPKMAPLRPFLGTGVRVHAVDAYLIAYREIKCGIEILHVVRASRNLQDLF